MAVEPRAGIATDARASRGRLYPEPASPTRSAFRRDCDRLIHSTAFRRLAHKTQVFVFHEGDHFRTRLTHTLEVTQIARSLARALDFDEDLAEGAALGHDLGHPPFGHAGERALDHCLAAFGGFDHNAQTLRVVTTLERPYPAFDGLNLTIETLEGLLKHNGPLTDRTGNAVGKYAWTGLPRGIAEFPDLRSLEPWMHASAEAQAGAISDDIAYDAHDIDDGLRAGMFAIEDLAAVPLVGDILRGIDAGHPCIEPSRRVHELRRRLITRMIEDVIAQTQRNVTARGIASAEGVRAADGAVVTFSPQMAQADRAIKDFLLPRLYRHERIMRIMRDAERVVRELFAFYLETPDELPAEWRQGPDDPAAHALRVADFIAGMTDRYAMIEHARLIGDTPELR